MNDFFKSMVILASLAVVFFVIWSVILAQPEVPPQVRRVFDDKLDVVCWYFDNHYDGLTCLPANTVNITGLKEVLGITE